MNAPRLSVRRSLDNPNHHLWDNHGTFWGHFTVHLPDYTKARLRLSLGTPNVEEARRRRDALMRLFGVAQLADH